jgi:hypothetical protein
MQLAYQNYEGMGVPISGEIFSRSRKPNHDDVIPYLYEGTTEEDYILALSEEKSNCCLTFSEFFTSKHSKDDNKIEWMKQDLAGDMDQTESFTCEFTADYVDNGTFETPQKSKSRLPNHASPPSLYFHMPLPKTVLLLYSDFFVDTYFPGDLASHLPIFY